MKIFKYTTVVLDDIKAKYIFHLLIDLFSFDIIEKQIHTTSELNENGFSFFFFYANEYMQNQLTNFLIEHGVLINVEDFEKYIKFDINKFDNNSELSNTNIIWQYFIEQTTKNDILDKIIECGFDTLTDNDKMILDLN